MEINQLVCFCRVGPYILNEGGHVEDRVSPWEAAAGQVYLPGGKSNQWMFLRDGGKTWVRHRSFPAGWSRAPCHTDRRPGGWWGDGQVMKAFFFFIMSSVEGFVLWEHTLWCCLQERPPFGLQVDELDQLLVRTVGTLTLDWQSFIPGRIHRASHKKIKHDALLLDIYWCPVGLRQMTISIINESISWVYEMLKKGGNSLSQLPRSEGVILKLPFLSRIPKLFIWLQMTEKINRLTNILKIQLLQLLYS